MKYRVYIYVCRPTSICCKYSTKFSFNLLYIQHEGCAQWDVESNDVAGGIACCVCCHRIFLAVYMLLQLFAIFSQFISTPDSFRILASLVWKLPTLFLCAFCEKGWVLNLCLYSQSELIIFIYDGKTNLNTHTHTFMHTRGTSHNKKFQSWILYSNE